MEAVIRAAAALAATAESAIADDVVSGVFVDGIAFVVLYFEDVRFPVVRLL